MANQQDMLPCSDPQKNFLGPFVQLKKKQHTPISNFHSSTKLLGFSPGRMNIFLLLGTGLSPT